MNGAHQPLHAHAGDVKRGGKPAVIILLEKPVFNHAKFQKVMETREAAYGRPVSSMLNLLMDEMIL